MYFNSQHFINSITKLILPRSTPLNFIKRDTLRFTWVNGVLYTHILGAFYPKPSIQAHINGFSQLDCSALDDLRREQFNKIVGKIGIKKKDAGMYWKQYKIKRIKIRKRKRVI